MSEKLLLLHVRATQMVFALCYEVAMKTRANFPALIAVATTVAASDQLISKAEAAGDRIRSLIFVTEPHGSDPQLFQAAELIVQTWRELGLDVKIRAMPRPQQLNVVWHTPNVCGGTGCWDATTNKMSGRPARSDPDEFIFNLYHSSTSHGGFNFAGYRSAEYDLVAQKQRTETDKEKRRELIFQAQSILDRDQPTFFLVNPAQKFAFNRSVWDESSVIDQAGLGIRNFWTYINIRPLGAQKTLIINSGEPLRAIHPQFVGSTVASWMQELIWDRLLRINREGLPEPWAAESYKWLDDKTIQIVLRPDMKWHDGQPVTTDDVTFTFGEIGDKAPMYTPYTNIISQVKVIDARTAQIILKEPSAPFLTSTLANVNLTPAHIWRPIIQGMQGKAQNLESVRTERPIGSGPFRFVRWKENEELVLERNPDHWAAPKSDRLIVRIVPNMEATLNMLLSGEINFLTHYTGDPDVLAQLVKQNDKLRLVITPDIGFEYVTPNLRRKPFSDTAFRRALSLAIDRDLIVSAAYKDAAVKVNSPISGVLKYWHNPETDKFKPNIQEAKNILKDAGYVLVGGRLHYPDGVKETEVSD